MEGSAVATSSRAQAPTLDQLVARAEGLLPRLRERAKECEALRRVPDETIQDFQEAGLLRVLQPARWGGYELDYGRTQVRLNTTLGRACGSSAWVQSVLACHAWIVAMYPPAVQEAVWGRDPDILIASSFSPSTGRAEAVDGGYRVRGDWQFSSGCHACQWAVLGAPVQRPDGPPDNLWFLLPRPDWEIVDTWYAPGLRGSGSHDVRVHDAFVPAEFVLDRGQIDGRPTPGSALNPSYQYRLPLYGFFPFNVAPPALGIARGAIEAYVEQTAARPERAQMPQRQLRIAESSAEVDAAEALLLADCAEVERRARAGEPLDGELLARLTRDLSFSVRLCTQAIGRLAATVGAHGMSDENPVMRAMRDVQAVGNHIANNWDLQALPYARGALGLPPERPF
jgi:3-hydroxy-9,10-secoandrosta-1,3,5(10)-triene-9,17-dione monooxygenase